MSTGCPETGQTFMLKCTDNEYRVSLNRTNLHVTMHRQWVQGVLKQEKHSCYNAQTPSILSTGCPETSQTFMLQCTDNEYRVSWNKTNLHVTMHRQWVQGVLKQEQPSCYNAQTMSTGCPETRATFMLQCTDNEYRVSWNKTNLHVTMHRHLQSWVQGVLKQDKPLCYNTQTMSTGCPETGQTFMLQCTDNEYRVSWNKTNLHVTMHRQWVQGVLKQEQPSCYNAQTMSTGCPETRQTFMLQCTDNEYRVSWNKSNLHVTMHRQWVQGVLKQEQPSCYNAQTMSTGCPETRQTFMLQCTDNEYRVSWNKSNLHVTMHRQWVQGVLKQGKPSCYNAQTMSTGCPETGQTFMLQCTDNEYRVSWNKTNLHVTMHRQWVQGVLKQGKPSCYNAQTMSTGCPETGQTFMLQCTDNEYRVSWNKTNLHVTMHRQWVQGVLKQGKPSCYNAQTMSTGCPERRQTFMLQWTDNEYRVSWNRANLHVTMHRQWVQGVLKQEKPSCYNAQTPSILSTGCPETSQTFMLQCTDNEYRVSWNRANLHVTMHRQWVQGVLKQDKPSCYNAQTPSILSTGCP